MSQGSRGICIRLLSLCVVVGALSEVREAREGKPWFRALSVDRGGERRNPREMTNALTGVTVAGGLAQIKWPQLTALGAKHTSSIMAGQWWRLFTPMLLHGSPLHFACNMFSLQSVGPALEAWYGPERTLGVYLIAGACGNLASCYAHMHGLSLGASGAIAGLVGALTVHYSRHHDILGERADRVLEGIGRVIVLNAAIGIFAGGIDNAAHLGGLIGGAAAGFLIGCRFIPVRDRYGRVRGYRDEPLLKL